MKRIVAILLVLSLVTIPMSVSAQETVSKEDLKAKIEKEIKENKLREKYKDIDVPDIKELKKSLEKEFKKDPISYDSNMKQIDEIAQSFVDYIEIIKEYDIVAQDFRIYPHWHVWRSGPTITNTNRNQIDGNIYDIDNRQSSVPYHLEFSETLEVSFSVGFSGSAEIKKVITASIQATGSYKYEQTITGTIDIPAYTYWGKQVHAYKTTDSYTGVLDTWSYVPVGTVLVPTLMESSTENGTNKYGSGGGIHIVTK